MTQPKYRPYMTLPQIKAVLELIEDMSNCISYTKPTEIKEVETTLKLLLIKAEAGAVTPNYVPTGNKPGPVSARELVLSDSNPKDKIVIDGKEIEVTKLETPDWLKNFQDNQTKNEEK